MITRQRDRRLGTQVMMRDKNNRSVFRSRITGNVRDPPSRYTHQTIHRMLTVILSAQEHSYVNPAEYHAAKDALPITIRKHTRPLMALISDSWRQPIVPSACAPILPQPAFAASMGDTGAHQGGRARPMPLQARHEGVQRPAEIQGDHYDREAHGYARKGRESGLFKCRFSCC